MAWSPDGTLLAASSGDKVWIWNTVTGKNRYFETDEDFVIRHLAWYPDEHGWPPRWYPLCPEMALCQKPGVGLGHDYEETNRRVDGR